MELVKQWAYRDLDTGRWAVDYPPTLFSERMADARLLARPQYDRLCYEYATPITEVDDVFTMDWEPPLYGRGELRAVQVWAYIRRAVSRR